MNGGPPAPVDGIRTMPIDDRTPREFLRGVERETTQKYVHVARVLKILLFLGLLGGWLATLRIWSFCYVPPEAVRLWFETHISPELLVTTLRVGVGLPVQILLLVEPFLVFLLVYLVLASLLERAINWIRYRRWEEELLPADLSACRYTISQRVIRTCFTFFLVWSFWFLGTGMLVLFAAHSKILPRPPGGSGFLRWGGHMAMVLGLLALLLAMPVAVAFVYRRFRKRLNHRFPFLK